MIKSEVRACSKLKRQRGPSYVPVSRCAAQPQSGSSAVPIQQRNVKYSPLHKNIIDFCQRIEPTPQEIQEKKTIVEGIKLAAKHAFADISATQPIKVEVFGSFANGLSTWNSDVDLVITGLAEPDSFTGVFTRSDKSVVIQSLDKLAKQLRKLKRLGLRKLVIIRTAKIPIIKLRSRSSVCCDISVADNSGPRAARYVSEHCRSLPMLRPLMLVVKALLKSRGLNEVVSGGLSSYSLTNMAIAHLQEEIKSKRDISDFGEVLYGFLLRYGTEFSYSLDAVSVGNGGIVRKSTLGYLGAGRYGSAVVGVVREGDRLTIEDPLTGRDIAVGSYRIDSVADLFSSCAHKLEQLVLRHRGEAFPPNYLMALYDVNKVCRRSHDDLDAEYFFLDKNENEMDEDVDLDVFDSAEVV